MNKHTDPFVKHCDCCHYGPEYPDRIPKPIFPGNGPMQGNAFAIVNNVPYLIDNTNVSYGQHLSVSENINTYICQKPDLSCINLSGSIDLTTSTTLNPVWVDFLNKLIQNNYVKLQHILDVIKSNLNFKLYYTITDVHNQVMYSGSTTTTVKEYRFHETDVKDFFVTSAKNIFFTNIPPMTYEGRYNITIDKVAVIVDTLDVKSHIVNELNPYYSFINNNTKIQIFHDMIESEVKDNEIIISETVINRMFSYQSNITTRLRFAFTAFMSNLIYVQNTLSIWKGLYEPTDTILHDLLYDVTILKQQVLDLQTDVEQLKQKAPYDKVTFIKDYLFDASYSKLDYTFAKDFFMNNTLPSSGGCTSVRKGNYFGRNFDWNYNNYAYFRIRVERSKNVKYQSICNCGNIPQLTNDFVKSGKYSDMYKILPFHCLDGINEKHVLCSMNVVPANDYGITTGTIPTSDKRDTICVLMLLRYILDNFASAQEAVTYLQEHVSIYAPDNIGGIKEEFHCMVCDMNDTFLIEFINNEMVVINMTTELGNRKYMTNFHLYATTVDSNNHINYASVTPYGNGLERYDTITDGISAVNNADTMFTLMKSVWYTNAYNFDDYNWKTELSSREYDLKITDPIDKYQPYIELFKKSYRERNRDTGKTWQTVFTSVYDMEKCRMYLMTQEDDSEVLTMEYDNHYTKEEIDSMITQIPPYILNNATGVLINFDTNEYTHYGLPVDDVTPYQRKRCNVTDDGVIVAYYGDTAYTETGALTTAVTIGETEYPIGTQVQTMVYQPKTYYRVEPIEIEKIENGEGYHIKKARYEVSNTQLPGFKLHPAFIDETGNEVEYILISAFEGCTYDTSLSAYNINDDQTIDFTPSTGDKLSSIGSAKPISGLTQLLTRTNAEIIANNRGEGWHLYNIKIASLNQLLMLIEYGNSQLNVGKGIVDIPGDLGYNCSSYTGSTTGNGTGNASSTINEINGDEVTYTDNGKVSVNYRGMENPWGNMYEHVNGITVYDGIPYVCKDFNYAETKHDDNYISAGITVPTEVGYTKYFGYGNYECDWLFIPSAVEGTSDNLIGDYMIINPTAASHHTPIIGGSWADNTAAGIYCCNVFNLTAYYARNVGARIVYYPE